MSIGTLIRDWWNQEVDVVRFLDFLESRALAGHVRVLIGGMAGLFAATSLVTQLSTGGPQGEIGRIVSASFAAGGVLWMMRWLFGSWPSPLLSAVFIAYADLGITVACLQDVDRLAGLNGAMLLVAVGTYASFFHGPKVVVAHLAWSLFSVVVFAFVIATGPDGDPAMATAKAMVAVVTWVVVPLMVQFGLWMLRSDGQESLVDSLTGVLNRRGTDAYAVRLMQSAIDAGGERVVVLALIDLDRFKAINDTHGHAVGDEVLTRTSQRITGATRKGCVVGRVGGEEFVVVEVMGAAEVHRFAERVCRAIAAPADRALVTASIGVASVSLDRVPIEEDGVRTTLIRMMMRADHAMYVIKKSGGNGVSIDETPPESN